MNTRNHIIPAATALIVGLSLNAWIQKKRYADTEFNQQEMFQAAQMAANRIDLRCNVEDVQRYPVPYVMKNLFGNTAHMLTVRVESAYLEMRTVPPVYIARMEAIDSDLGYQWSFPHFTSCTKPILGLPPNP